ncbi:hypothetical protein PINS_up021965 [Pythium insidiosum]|nr:hypothetical protein PINS_up005942 [Pythium insidiosum]GLE09991.1 hypothetical protein PINS_up021965 [Pythium insidiosum]
MNYDFMNMVEHTCVPPAQAHTYPDESVRVEVVHAAMQSDVDALAIDTADTPREIWAGISAKYYSRDDNVVVQEHLTLHRWNVPLCPAHVQAVCHHYGS